MNEHSKSREELERQNAELQAAIQARDEFLAVAAHELRSPMHALLLQLTGLAEVARRKGDADVHARSERLKQVVERYVRRATTLLDVSRVNLGQLKLHFEDVDLAQVVQETVDAYAAEAAHHGSTVNIAARGVLRGRWDRTGVEQVVTNLLINAIKYGDGQPIHVALASDGEFAQLEVRDGGIGLSAADQARIFERFERVVTTHTQGGFGVGLWLVRTLVEAHGGSIAIESAPNQGSTFTVRLPLEPSNAQDAI